MSLIAPVRGSIIWGTALQVLGTIAGFAPLIAVIMIVRVVADSGLDLAAPTALPGEVASEVWWWLGVGLVGLCGRLILTGAGVGVTHFAEARLGELMRARITAHVGRLPLGWVQSHASGRVKKLLTDDVSALHTLVAHTIGDIAVGVVNSVFCLVALFLFSWQLGLLSLLPLVAFVAAFGRMMGAATSQLGDWEEAKARINSATVEFVHGIGVVKTFGQAGRSSQRYRDAVDEYQTFFERWMGPMMSASARGFALIAAPTVTAVMAIGGGLMLAAGWIDVTAFAAGLVLGIGIAGPLAVLQNSGVGLRAAREAADRITELLAEPVMPDPRVTRSPLGGTVELENATFRYPGAQHPAVDDVDLVLREGTLTALVGASGSGKSTLASLVPRFWDVESGRITLGGADLRDIDSAELYEGVGFVFQRSTLLPLSVHENIALARPAATREEVVGAARAAGIHDRIVDLPDGYDTVLDGTVRLSGGERQRVTIARAMLTDAPVLVLDEATAAVDPEAEAAVQAAVSALAAGRTVLVIAHRLRTVVGADTIVVLDDGRIAERGIHDELLARGGAYSRLWHAQSETATS